METETEKRVVIIKPKFFPVHRVNALRASEIELEKRKRIASLSPVAMALLEKVNKVDLTPNTSTPINIE